jgi:hypothetical protein
MFWKFNCASTSDGDVRGVVAAGSSRVEVGTRIVIRDLKSALIHGNVGVRVSATIGVHLFLILSLIVKFFAQVVAFQFAMEAPGVVVDPAVLVGGPRAASAMASGVGEGVALLTQDAASLLSAGVRLTSYSPIFLRIGQSLL